MQFNHRRIQDAGHRADGGFYRVLGMVAPTQICDDKHGRMRDGFQGGLKACEIQGKQLYLVVSISTVLTILLLITIHRPMDRQTK